MDDGDARDQIAQLEARIEALSDSIARCAKISLGAKIAIACGAAWFALLILGIIWFNATGFVAAMTAVLGGVVLLGSNATTWAQTEADLNSARAARADFIGSLELRVVSERPTLH
ncbi:MAG TPA: hypothetical protein VGC38_02420 [Pseudolabrys sp.]